jgi:two-component system sensor histidine kinase KdpD
MSRIEEGALKPEKEWYQLTSLVQDVLDRLQPLLQERVVRMDLPRDIPPVELDYLQIDQVLTNLIENAVRYTPPESPIEVAAQYHNDEVLISVADRGPGIPVEDLERIFDKFYRVLNDKHYLSTGGTPTGSGLGLAVCKGLIEAHGGRIWAQPREGGGVVFCVAFPVGTLEGSLV